MEPPIKDPLRLGRPLYKGHLLRHHANTLVYYFTSEIGTTSLQGIKLLAPKCPLFGGSAFSIVHCVQVLPLYVGWQTEPDGNHQRREWRGEDGVDQVPPPSPHEPLGKDGRNPESGTHHPRNRTRPRGEISTPSLGELYIYVPKLLSFSVGILDPLCWGTMYLYSPTLHNAVGMRGIWEFLTP